MTAGTRAALAKRSGGESNPGCFLRGRKMRTTITGVCLYLAIVAAGIAHAGEVSKARVVLVGDSTLAPNSGYGNALCARFAPSARCLNMARSGDSSMSYREEGLWKAVLVLATKPPYTRSYVLIQFGHTDQRGKPGISTTLEQFSANLTRYVQEAREVGAQPVLVTPLTRRKFENGKVARSLEQWAEATRQVAEQMQVPLLDLNRDSVNAVEGMGSTAANTLARGAPPPDVAAAALTGTTIAAPAPVGPLRDAFDYTHLGPKGAEFFAALVAQEIRGAIPALGRHIEPE